MGWKGTVRSVGTAIRAADRDAKRRQRELVVQEKQYEKMQQLEQAVYEVEVYENNIEIIQSLHKESGEKVDWVAIAKSPPPPEPKNTHHKEKAARLKAENYKPGFFDKILKRSGQKQKQLNAATHKSQEADLNEHEKNIKNWKSDIGDWEKKTTLSKLLAEGDKESKINVIKELNPFSEISDLGSNLSFVVHENSIVEAEIHIHGEKIVPTEIKTLLQSGRLSVKKMPKGKYYEIYQDYVCSCVLRVANELFSILPDNMVIVTAIDEMLNTNSGHLEKLPILSIAVARKTLDSLNLNNIDPSDSMSNFIHNMSFKKTQGFKPVIRIEPEGLSNE